MKSLQCLKEHLILSLYVKQRLSLQNEWQGFLGEFPDAQKPLFVVRRALSLLNSRRNLAEVYMCSSAKRKRSSKPQSDYRVEGCYAKRSFTLLNIFNEVVAEVICMLVDVLFIKVI